MKYYMWNQSEQDQVSATEFETLDLLVEYLKDQKNWDWPRIQQVMEPLVADGRNSIRITERRRVSDLASFANLVAGRPIPMRNHDVTWNFCDKPRMEAAIQEDREQQRKIEEARHAVMDLIKKDQSE